jgi:prepilin-type N-terminal cleavage/methylation domain-containing protein
MMKKQDLKRHVGMTNLFVIRRRAVFNKAFTLIELMIVMAMITVLAATAMGMFQTYQIRAKTSEAVQGTSKMVAGETNYYAKNTTFLAAGPTNLPPAQGRQIVDFNTDPRWSELSFAYSTSIYYGYEAVLTATNSVDCEAQGDLNGNSLTSIFRRTVTFDGSVNVSSLVVFDELE